MHSFIHSFVFRTDNYLMPMFCKPINIWKKMKKKFGVFAISKISLTFFKYFPIYILHPFNPRILTSFVNESLMQPKKISFPSTLSDTHECFED